MSRPRKSKPLTKLGITRKRNEAFRRTQRRKSAEGCLSTDGACSTERIRNRLRWLAHEWQLSDEICDLPSDAPSRRQGEFVHRFSRRAFQCGSGTGIGRSSTMDPYDRPNQTLDFAGRMHRMPLRKVITLA
jgi:hypothetical protein